MRGLTSPQATMYAALQSVATTEHPSIVAAGIAELSVGRALERRGLAVINGRMIAPTPEAIEFRRGIAARRQNRTEMAA